MVTRRIPTALIALAAFGGLAFAGAGIAREADDDAWMRVADAQPRAAVVAERDAALAAARQLTIGNPDAWMLAPTKHPRERVEAELRAARQSGELQRLNAEAADFERPGVPARRMARL